VRHLGQKPSVRPGRPSRLRPAGSPQLPQKRCDSGTFGSFSTALAGSRSGTGGTSTRLAPSRPRPAERLRECPVLRPARPAPVGPVNPAVGTEGTPTDGPATDGVPTATPTGALWPHSSQ
jgi:hypothetical protein